MNTATDKARELDDARRIDEFHGEPSEIDQEKWLTFYRESLADTSAALDTLYGKDSEKVVSEKIAEILAVTEKSVLGFSSASFGSRFDHWRKEIATEFANNQVPEAAS